MDYIALRNRSYVVQRAVARGDQLWALEEIKRNAPVRIGSKDFAEWRPVTIKQGEKVLLLDVSNAGFRGIEVSVLTADGERLHGISAGLFGYSLV